MTLATAAPLTLIEIRHTASGHLEIAYTDSRRWQDVADDLDDIIDPGDDTTTATRVEVRTRGLTLRCSFADRRHWTLVAEAVRPRLHRGW